MVETQAVQATGGCQNRLECVLRVRRVYIAMHLNGDIASGRPGATSYRADFRLERIDLPNLRWWRSWSKPDRMIIANKSHEESHYFTASIAWSDRILMRSRPHARFACTIACHAISKSNPWQSLPRIAHCSPEMV